MPGPYTDAERDDLIDQLLATVQEQGEQIADLVARVGVLEDWAIGDEVRLNQLEADQATTFLNIGYINGQLSDLASGSADVIVDIKADLSRVGRRSQETDPDQLAKPQIVQREATRTVRRRDGSKANVVVKPR